MPATVIAGEDRLDTGDHGSRERVVELRPAYQVPSVRPHRVQARRAWSVGPVVPRVCDPRGHGQTAVLPVLVGVPCYSRWILARMIGSKESADVLGGHLRLVDRAGGGAQDGVYDGEPAISVRRGRQLIYTRDYLRLKGTLGMGSIVLAKGHPERKGVVERANGYLETSFMPGRHFTGRDDFNGQLGEWLATRAQRAGALGTSVSSVGAHRGGPGGDDNAAAASARHGLAPRPASARRPLGAPPNERLLGAPESGGPAGACAGRRRPARRHLGHRGGGPPTCGCWPAT